MDLRVPDCPEGKRIVIIGAGFAGVEFCNRMKNTDYQVVLIDQNNYHQFQPLFYQVATAGLEPSAICFPIRRLYQKAENIIIRCASLVEVDQKEQLIHTNIGSVHYDHLIFAMGGTTNYFGNKELEQNTIPMKSVSEAIYLRNEILLDLEKALQEKIFDRRQPLIDIVIVGGGPTGVELAGALVELKKYIIPKDYPELNADEIDIYLVQGGSKLLVGMSDNASTKAEKFLRKMGVNVILNDRVTGCNGEEVLLASGKSLPARKVIWAAGVTCRPIDGIEMEQYGHAHRLLVDQYHKIVNSDNLYALGDQALMSELNHGRGHAQLAQVAIQSATNLAKNFKRSSKNKTLKPFSYKDYGVMATVGRNKAVADIKMWKSAGFMAWMMWLVVHLRAILGVKNKLFVLINWIVNYLTYDQSLRLIIKPFNKEGEEKD